MTQQTPKIAPPTKVRWNYIDKVGTPPRELCTIGETQIPRTFLCRGHYSLFTSTLFDDLSGFTDQGDDPVVAWAVIDEF